MLEPVLPHNLAHFKRLGRYQMGILITAPVCGTALWIAIVFLRAPSWVESVLVMVVLGLSAGAIVVLEVKKTLLFRKDLHESRTAHRS